ncbi:MAG: diguanylate cyclase [Betaproteobacteria bacterium]|nr:MAG: diguanylate cyclase [Betaproteobacteria bacterium]
MRYQDSKEYSAELLRLVLPQMSAQDAAFNPLSYAVWYEYVSGINPELTEAVDAIIDDKKVLADDDVQEVYQRFIAERDESMTEKLQAELRRVMDEILQQAQATAKQAEQYGNELAEHTDALQSGGFDEGKLSKVIDELINGAQGMRHSVTELQTTVEVQSQEVESLKRELQQAISEAMTDPLTGLKNRRAFDRVFSSMIEDSAGAKNGHALLMLDVDHFKKVNDTYGHVFGDKALRSIAHVLQTTVKGGDPVARFGGEEFAVLLPDTAVEGAKVVAEKIREAVENGRIRGTSKTEDVGKITISIGVAAYKQGDTPEGLIERADQALYQSKSNGRNRVTVAESTVPQAA